MIPFAILSGNFIFHGNDSEEFRILDLSVDSFTFRVAEPFADGSFPDGFHLHFLQFNKSGYESLILTDFTIRKETPDEEIEVPKAAETAAAANTPLFHTVPMDSLHNDLCERYTSSIDSFCTYYRVMTESEDFFRLSLSLQKDYRNYVNLKLEAGPGELSEKLTGYPVAEEKHFASSWEQQKAAMMAGIHPDPGWSSLILPPCGFLLDHPSAWNRYLGESLSVFGSGYFREQELSNHPLAACQPAFLYIGNQFCPQLFPDDSTLIKLLQKAHAENLIPLLQFAPASESLLPHYENLLILCRDYAKSVERGENKKYHEKSDIFRFVTPDFPEIVVNDWGTMQLIIDFNRRNRSAFTVIPGTLLQKRRKDPRMKYSLAVGSDSSDLVPHLWNADFYIRHLISAYPLSGLLFESCGYPYRLPALHSDLQGKRIHRDLLLPFYQTNTATACTLRAVCEYGDRGKQVSCLPCPHYCKENLFLYPEFLQMTGRYNSLFGLDRRILEDSSYMQSFLKQGIDRLIFQFL